MAKAATMADLSELHALITRSFKVRLEQDIEDNIPTDAATLGALTKFLKDNAVTADPADSDDLSALRDKLKEQAQNRRKTVGNVVALATADLDLMTG